MTTTYDHARFIGVAIATAMNELDLSLEGNPPVVVKKSEPKVPAGKKAKPKRRTPKENSRIVHEVNGYLGMAKKAKTQAGARIWLLKATKATPSGWTATHNQIARKHALHCPDIAA